MEKVFKEENIKQIAKEILDEVAKTEKNKATVIALSGDLGAGKTTLTKEIAKQLGIKENIISPTFVIMKIYKANKNKFKKLIHIDAYRLSGSKELLALGWEDLILNKDNIILIEWPELVPECIISPVYKVELSHEDNTTRKIKFCYN